MPRCALLRPGLPTRHLELLYFRPAAPPPPLLTLTRCNARARSSSLSLHSNTGYSTSSALFQSILCMLRNHSRVTPSATISSLGSTMMPTSIGPCILTDVNIYTAITMRKASRYDASTMGSSPSDELCIVALFRYQIRLGVAGCPMHDAQSIQTGCEVDGGHRMTQAE